jgi:hypothetical protein
MIKNALVQKYCVAELSHFLTSKSIQIIDNEIKKLSFKVSQIKIRYNVSTLFLV